MFYVESEHFGRKKCEIIDDFIFEIDRNNSMYGDNAVIVCTKEVAKILFKYYAPSKTKYYSMADYNWLGSDIYIMPFLQEVDVCYILKHISIWTMEKVFTKNTKNEDE